MSPATTLVTFRVRAPSSTRTLTLYGSWDNFRVGYSMNKDLQSGSQYWSGCFNFSNIICDGRPSDVIRSRDGGLKMGGTYWYHYKLDDEADFHNVCERATTNCPMMPGQLVNVLNVPYALSGNRSRNASTSSTSSERRTMNPEDKFVNPRPAPAKPDLLRVSTSPTSGDFPESNDVSCTATPCKDTPNAARFLRLPRKRSVDAYTAPSPANGLTGGLRAAFRIRTARSQSPESKPGSDTPTSRRAVSAEREANRDDGEAHLQRSSRPQRTLILRSISDDTLPTTSFGERRQQRSAPNENSSPRVIHVEKLRDIEIPTLSQSIYHPLSALKEVASTSNSPIDGPAEDSATKSELNLEKRLPTLPNTPSSAYPMSVNGDSPPRHHFLDMHQLESHFSATTIDTEAHTMSRAFNGKSHFSAWTTASDTSSIFVDSSEPIPPFNRSIFMESAKSHGANAANEPFLPGSLSYSSMTSSASTTPSISYIDTDAEFSEFEAARASAGGTNAATPQSQVQHYSLPEHESKSHTTLKAPSQQSMGCIPLDVPFSNTDQQTPISSHGDEVIHSESMMRLLDELSYLSDIIQQ